MHVKVDTVCIYVCNETIRKQFLKGQVMKSCDEATINMQNSAIDGIDRSKRGLLFMSSVLY